MAGGRSFVDATGTPVPLRGAIRRVVATGSDVGELLVELGATVVGCAGPLDGVTSVGEHRAPVSQEVAAQRPDIIVTGTVDGRHDLADPATAVALGRIAPVIAVDLARSGGAVARADLRALLGAVGRTPAAAPVPGPLDDLVAAPPAPAEEGTSVALLGPRVAALVREVARTGEEKLLTDDGKPLAVIIGHADYEQLRELVGLARKLRLPSH
jgi:prevent-host-death family protein